MEKNEKEEVKKEKAKDKDFIEKMIKKSKDNHQSKY